MKTLQLGSILTDDQLEAVLDILQTYRDDSVMRSRKLKEYLVGFRDDLESKGVVPEYLAYIIEYQVSQLDKPQQPYERN